MLSTRQEMTDQLSWKVLWNHVLLYMKQYRALQTGIRYIQSTANNRQHVFLPTDGPGNTILFPIKELDRADIH